MKRLLVLSFITLLVLGCKSSFTDVSSEMNFSNISLPENKHAYSATWLSKNTIIFVKKLVDDDFDHDYLFNPKSIVVLDELYSYDLDTHEWEKFALDTNLDCHAQDIGWLARLPNNKLGLVQSCRGITLDIIQEFDLSNHETRALFKNNISPNMEIKWVGSYAFSPDMTELVQEYPIGRFLSNQLYYIKLGEKPRQIFPNFIRVMYPDWSPHNREIAFWGTENYSDNENPDLKTTQDIVGLASYPWNLYISSPEGNDVRLMFSSIENPGGISWSPTKDIIAFSGEFEGKQGLWLFDPVSLEITRIWNKQVGFSWSPDGTRIIATYLKHSDYPQIEEQSVDIIEIP
jgi:hypothetical protein